MSVFLLKSVEEHEIIYPLVVCIQLPGTDCEICIKQGAWPIDFLILLSLGKSSGFCPLTAFLSFDCIYGLHKGKYSA